MIETIHEHKVDLLLLPEKANILDLGCRGFLFTKAMRDLGHHVLPVDIDELYESQAYYQMAISDHDGRCGVHHTNDPQATSMKEGDTIPCYTLDAFSRMVGVDRFDLIKMDIEGSEYQVIMSLKAAPAKQLSIEFHVHTGQITERMMREMENKLKNLGYEFTSHELTNQHGAGFNYWDSLFILK